MIEQYLYSIPKRKKIFYGVLLTWLFLALLSHQVDCGIFTWIAGKVTDNITDEIFTSINQSLGAAIGSMIDWFFNVLLKPLGPQLTTFTKYTNFASVSLEDFIHRFSVFSGMFLATLIFGFGICIYFFSGKITDSRDTPVSLFARYCVAIAICYQHKTIYETILKMIDDFFSSMTYTLTKDMMKQEGILNIVAKTADDKLEILGKEAIIDFAFPGVGLIILIIQIILIWKIIKGFLKLYCEMVSRYIVTIVLLLLFAAFGGTIVSNNTSSIFKSYLRTLFCSFLVMIFNMVWFKGCFFAVLGGNKFTFIQYIFVLELLAFGLKFDGMLRSMGLGVATGGSRIGNAIGGAGRNIANSLRMANDARKAGGNLLQAKGLATNNPDMFRAGTKMAASPFDALKPGQGGVMQMAAMNGAMGKKIADNLVTPKDAADIMNFAAKNPGNRDAMNALNGLSDNSILAGAKHMAAQNGIKVNDVSVCQFRGSDGKQHTGVKISGEKAQLDNNGKPVLDENGNPKTHDVNGVLGDTKAFDSCQQIGDGSTGMGLHCDNTLKNGETCSAADAADIAGQSTADALQKAQENGLNLSDNAYLEKDGRDSNGQDAFNLYDNGKQVGTIAGGEFTAASDLNGVSNDDLRQAEAKEEIANQSGVSEVGDMKATGFTATAESTSGESSSLTPTAFSATAYDSDSAQSITASVEPNSDGSSAAMITGENGQSASFNIPEGSSFEEALSSEEGQNALSSVSAGGETTEFTPTGFSAEAVNEDGSVSSLSARFESNDDGSATGIVTNEGTGQAASFNVPEGATLDEAFASEDAQNAISSVSGGAEVSDFAPSEYSAISLDENPSGSTLSASFETNDDGSMTGTITNDSTGESSSFSVPAGTSYEDALSSNDAREAIGNVTDSDIVTGFSPTEYGASTDCGHAETTVSAAFSENADGSSTATLTNTETGESISFNVPQGTSYEDALSSEGALNAVSSITDGGKVDSFTPNEYSVPVTRDDGSSGNYSVHFDENGDGTYDAHISDSDGNNVKSYSSNDDTYGNGIRDSIMSSGDYDSVSNFEPVDGRPGVYQATATQGDIQTVITATDKGVYAESRLNDDPRSMMYVSETGTGNRVAYDVNFGKSYDSSQRDYGSNRSYGQRFEEEQVGDESRERMYNNDGRNSKPKAGRRNGRRGGR